MAVHPECLRTPEKPMGNRFLAGLLAVMLGMSAAPATARDALTVERALRLAEDFQPLQEELTAETELAGALARRRGTWPNPALAVSRERFDADGAVTTQRFYSLSQAFDLSGQRGFNTAAARAMTEGVLHDTAWTLREHRTRVRRRFYTVLLHQQRADALEAGLEQLDRVARIVTERHRAGTASGYERRRIERERAGLEARVHRAEADRLQAWEALHVLIAGADVPNRVRGSLSPDAPASMESYLQHVVERGDLQHLRAQARSARLEQRAASRAWVPDPTIGLGYTTVDQPGPDGGGMLARISIPLPVFDRGQADSDMASARQRQAEARYQRHLQEIRAQVRGLWRRTRQLSEAYAGLQAQTRDSGLTAIAESAYRAGELGILELLDAYRGQLEARLNALEIAHATRIAYIELVHASGRAER